LKNLKNNILGFFNVHSSSKEFSFRRIIFYLSMAYTYTYLRPLGGQVNDFLSGANDELWKPESFFQFFSLDLVKSLYFEDMDKVFIFSLLMCAFGISFRLFSIVAFFLALFLIGVPINFGKVHHSNFLPLFFIGFFIFSKYSGVISVDALLKKIFFKKSEPKESLYYMLPFQMMLVHFSSIYFASGFQKMRFSGLDWIFSDNMRTIILTRPTVTELGASITYYPKLAIMLAMITVFFELFSPLALFHRYTKFIFVGGIMAMHIGAKATLGAHGDFTPYVLSLLVFIPWYSWFYKPIEQKLSRV
tara:strand:+ start:3529 stop:4437 length:909 start_codon:yes stop_codon:yes gene_type:complete